MWFKVSLGLLFTLFVGIQIASSLKCYSCDTPASCRDPGTQVCSNETANATNTWLNAIHLNVPQTGGNNKFKCMNLTYFLAANSTRVQEYLGCFHAEVPVCGLYLNATNSSSWARNCRTCDYDLCNRNPAATFSQSSYTIVASVLGLLIAKLLV